MLFGALSFPKFRDCLHDIVFGRACQSEISELRISSRKAGRGMGVCVKKD